ncbi:MAG: hypothetical protein R2754_12590 [Microthrixaceae bacterium]
MRIACVTTDDLAALGTDEVDRPFNEAAFAAAGIQLDYLPWTQPADWERFDLVVIRSPWDYPERTAEFLAWLGTVEHLPTLMNPAPIIRWNLDKQYLAELGAAGVPVVATGYATSIDAVDSLLAAAVDRAEAGEGPAEVVVKPTISAGSRNTGRFSADDPAARSLAETILSIGGTVMVQPAITSVAERGEVGVVVFDGAISHGLTKAPILDLGGGLLGGDYRETVSPAVPTPAQRDVVLRAVRAVQNDGERRGWLKAGEPLLYGRYDVVRMDDGTEALLEAELFEPSFFLQVDPGSPDRFVEAVRRRAEAVARTP